MRTINLTLGKVALVDDEDFERVNSKKWYAEKIRGTKLYYARRTIYSYDGSKKRYNLTLHRFLMDLERGDKRVADHINNNTLDDQKHNLKKCSQRINTHNQKRRKEGRTHSKYIGVTFDKKKNYWISRIYIKRKSYFLGCFKKEKNAATTYQKALSEVNNDTFDIQNYRKKVS